MRLTPPGIVFGAAVTETHRKNDRRARIVRAQLRLESAAAQSGELTISPPTIAQTVCLLALSRGEQPRAFPPITRRELLRKRWIASSGRTPGARSKREHDITDAGRRALATSPHLAAAQKALDDKERNPVWR
jgi:hypothetical protein